MNILIVHAHENQKSFSSALAQEAKNHFTEKGHKVTLSDLYAKEFSPVAGKDDFIELSDASYYKYALEQLNAHNKNLFDKDLKQEMAALAKVDVLIFNFPLWWFGMPAILKGWVDRVLAYGFAYGGEYGLYNEGRFAGKKAFLSITTGSTASFYEKDGVHNRQLNDILRNVHEGILGLIGFEVLPPFIGYGVSRITRKEREGILENYQDYLQHHFLE